MKPSSSTQAWNYIAAIGVLIWCGFLLGVHPSPQDVKWARLLLLLGPLVLVPLGLGLWECAIDRPARRPIVKLVKLFALPAALMLAAAQWLDQGWLAAALALPWLAVTVLIATLGISDAWPNRRGPVDWLCIDAGLAYIAVGGAWAAIDRSGWRPLDFEPVIVMLTAIHFHFAGFVLPIITGLTARRVGGSLSKAACIGVVAGMPLVAIGITGTKLGLPPLIETAAAWWMSAAGILSAISLLRAAWKHSSSKFVSTLWTVAAISLAASMALAALYGMRHLLPMPWLDIPFMRITHGTANALGFGVCAILGWTLEFRRSAPLGIVTKQSRNETALAA